MYIKHIVYFRKRQVIVPCQNRLYSYEQKESLLLGNNEWLLGDIQISLYLQIKIYV